MKICVFEDDGSSWLGPVVLTRPVWELLRGPITLLDRIVSELRPDEVALWCRRHLTEVVREESPATSVNEPLHGEWLLVNGRWLGIRADLPIEDERSRWVLESDGAVAAAKVALEGESPEPEGAPPRELLQSLPRVSVHTQLARYPWELVEACPQAIDEEVSKRGIGGRLDGVIEGGAVCLEQGGICLAEGSTVGAGSVLDARRGPIWIDEGSHVGPLTVIEGPFYLGKGSVVNAAARICGGCSFGPGVKVGGEVENSVIQGFTNKQHDGFLGHSYVGSWVNLGAGTTTSDLKNNYHAVRVELAPGEVATGRLKVGLFMGDHTTTGIGTLFTTGSVVGAGCNLFGGGMMPKTVASFTWGDGAKMERYRLSEMLETAATMMRRRGKALSPGRARVLEELHLMTSR